MINIHWIGNEIISLNDLINTEKIIWTMHDLWPLTSTEHFLAKSKKSYQFRDTKNNFLKKKFLLRKKII